MADHFEVVDTVSGRQEAEIPKSFLRAQDIACEISQEAAGYVLGITIDGMGAVQILVPANEKKKSPGSPPAVSKRAGAKILTTEKSGSPEKMNRTDRHPNLHGRSE